MLRQPLLWTMLLLSPWARSQGLLFDRISMVDGLPSEEVNVLFEDSSGFIWAGTGDGLARLEGTRVRVFHHDHYDSTSLAHDQVNGIAQDAAGGLWFATMDGLAQFDAVSGRFTNWRIRAVGNDARLANRMHQVVPAADSLLWVVTEAGLYRYRIREGSFQHMQGAPPGKGPGGMVINSSALCWDARRATLWVGTLQGLASWNARTDAWTDHRTAREQPWANTQPTDAPLIHGDSLWFLRHKPYVLVAYDLRGRVLHEQPDVEDVPNRFGLRCQAIDPDGTHWLSTWTHRLFRRQPGGTWREVRKESNVPASITSTHIGDMLRTSGGERWFATSRGIAILGRAGASFERLPFNANGFSIIAVRPIGRDTLLVGTAGGGVHIFDMRTGSSVQHRMPFQDMADGAGLLANMVNEISAPRDGRVLVCTDRGLAELDIVHGTYRPMLEVMKGMPSEGRLHFSFAEREGNNIWLGTWEDGLWRYDTRSNTLLRTDTLPPPDGRLPSPMMLSWVTARDGRSWVGMNDGGGLAVRGPGGFRTMTDERGANAGGVVRVLAEGPDGRIWMGTHEQGIAVYDPGTGAIRHYTRRDGLPGLRIMALHFAADGTLWAMTSQGPAFKAPQSPTFNTLRLPADLAVERNLGPIVQLADGRLVMGLGERLLVHDPLAARESASPACVITGYRVNAASMLGPPPPLELAADRKALTVELGVVGGPHGRPPRFRYRLMPNDSAWQEIGTSQRIDLFDLLPGTHRVEVQASADGVHWDPRSAIATVKVLPPFHATWWFRSLVAAAMMLAVFLGFRSYLTGRLRQQREAFEREQAILAERMRIASDMHDDLGAGLSALKLRSEMALRVERDPEKREQLGSLARTAGELIGNMRQIIWTMNTDQSSLADLMSYTTNHVRSYCAENGLAVHVDLPPAWPAIELSAEQRRNIFLVVKEALHNTVKHAGADAVRLLVDIRKGLQVTVEDDGVGLPKHAQESVGNGLRNMRKRITALGGELEMSRGPDGGTVIRFRVPLITPNEGSIVRSPSSRDLRAQ